MPTLPVDLRHHTQSGWNPQYFMSMAFWEKVPCKALVDHYGDRHKVKEAYPHPLFIGSEFYNDIAIVELDDVIDFTKHHDSPLCLPNEPLNVENITWDGQPNRALIQGAGTNEDDHITGIDGILYEAEVEPISNEDCNHWINNSTSIQLAR